MKPSSPLFKKIQIFHHASKDSYTHRRNQFTFSLLWLFLLAMCLFTGCASPGRETKNPDSQPAFYITVPKIGKADAAVLYMEGSSQAIVIDTGEEEDGAEIVSILENLGVTEIPYIIITHFDKDHMGGAPYILEKCSVGQIIQPAYPGQGKHFNHYQEALEGLSNVYEVTEPYSLSLGEISLDIFPENDPENQFFDEEDDNNRSLVTFVTCQEQRFLFSGDIEMERIHMLLDSEIDLSCDWIKLPHHGSYYANLEEFLLAAHPVESVICCSEKNPADPETLALLQKLQIPVYQTANGDVTFSCDGTDILPLQ